MKKEIGNYLLTLLGVVILVAGLVILKFTKDSQGVWNALPYVCIGFGCGVFGHGMGNVTASRALKNNPDLQKQIEIERKDERNMAIANRAKAKAYDMMTYVFGALLLSFALMGVEVVAVLLLVSCYLFVCGYGIYCRIKYEKEM